MFKISQKHFKTLQQLKIPIKQITELFTIKTNKGERNIKQGRKKHNKGERNIWHNYGLRTLCVKQNNLRFTQMITKKLKK